MEQSVNDALVSMYNIVFQVVDNQIGQSNEEKIIYEKLDILSNIRHIFNDHKITTIEELNDAFDSPLSPRFKKVLKDFKIGSPKQLRLRLEGQERVYVCKRCEGIGKVGKGYDVHGREKAHAWCPGCNGKGY